MRNLLRKLGVFMLALVTGLSTLTGGGCKRLADKPAPFKRAVYLTTAAIGLDKIADALAVLDRAGQINQSQYETARAVLLSSAKVYQEVDRLLFAGDAPGAVNRINEILLALERLQDDNTFHIMNEDSRAWFAFILELTKAGVAAFSNFVRTQSPGVQVSGALVERMDRARTVRSRGGVPTYIIELTGLVVAAQTAVNNLLFLPTTEDVRAVGVKLATALIARLEPSLPPLHPLRTTPTKGARSLPRDPDSAPTDRV